MCTQLVFPHGVTVYSVILPVTVEAGQMWFVVWAGHTRGTISEYRLALGVEMRL